MIREFSLSLLVGVTSLPPWGIGLLLCLGIIPAVAAAEQRKRDGVQEWEPTHTTVEVRS